MQPRYRTLLKRLQRESFQYFLHYYNPDTGLVADKSKTGSPASISVTGMAISVFISGIEEGLISREDARQRISTTLRFLYAAEQSTSSKATGYKGFYYHFLHMETGERFGNTELSTVDTAFFIAGVLSAAVYFNANTKEENELRDLAQKLYRRINWQWACNKGLTITHGYKPKSGFLEYRWNKEYSEAILLYVLALASPDYPVNPEGYLLWQETFKMTEAYGINYLYAGPLFIHQLSHLWIDFREIQDTFNQKHGLDYFENSKRATFVHQAYAINNPKKFERYGKVCWGLTACDGPGNKSRQIGGTKRKFYGYKARGAPYGPDDGTLAPWAVLASLPFAPEIVMETTEAFINHFNLNNNKDLGIEASFNPSFPVKNKNADAWVEEYRFGLNQAPIVLMIANYENDFLWKLMRQCPYIISGLEKAGFAGGWLAEGGG
ncbi:MAG: glucoamylase family protein [Ferruginibacter sp.]